MKHWMLLTAALLAAPAWAQSSVTLSGVADAALRVVDNAGLPSARTLASGSNATSRLIFRGVEDMGGGLYAGFHLEHGISLDTGTPASSQLFFDRRSTVSLGDRKLGELRIGRDFVPTYNNWSRYDPFSYVGVAGSNNFVSATPLGPIRSAFGSGLATTVRSSNSVQWLLPAGWGGLEGEAMIAFREGGTAAAGQHDLRGARLGWREKAFNVGAAHTVSSNDLTAAGKFKDSSVGGSAQIGDLRLSLAWRRLSQNTARQSHLLAGVWWTFGLSELRASLHRVDRAGRVGTAAIDANDAHQLGLGFVHHLSKRSALYGSWSRIDNSGAATFVVPGGTSGLAGGKSSRGIEFGVRHIF